MTSSANTLFGLLRLALGTTPEPEDLSALTKADWEAVADMAFDQGAAAIMVDGLGSTPSIGSGTGSPTGLSGTNAFLESDDLEDLRYELFGEALACEEDYNKLQDTISALAKIYAEEQMDMMLLKGF